MPYDPSKPVKTKVELQINGVWTTVTSRARAAGDLRVKQGQTPGAIQPETSWCRVTIGNDDGYLTEGNPMSPWYPHIGRGTQIRASLTGILGSDAGLFTGQIEEMAPDYPGGSSSTMEILAIGTWGVLAANDDVLRSPLFRSMAGLAAGVGGATYTPHVYLSGEDGRDSTQLASGLQGGGPSVTPAGPVTFSVSGPLGSAPLVRAGAGFQATVPIPSYTDVGQWAILVAAKIEAEPAAPTTVFEVPSAPGGTAARWKLEVVPGSPTVLRWQAYNSSGSAIGGLAPQVTLNGTAAPAEANFFGQWFMISVASFQLDPSTVGATIGLADETGAWNVSFTVGAAGTHAALGDSMTISIDSNLDGIGLGHLGVFTDAAVDVLFGISVARALGGWVGETADERLERLCREFGIPLTIVGSSTKEMGPQRIATLTQLITDCLEVDGGLISDSRTQEGLTYRCLSDLYNQTGQVNIARGALTPDTKPVWDYQQIRNDWTVSRINGSSARASDEAHVARIGRRVIGSARINAATDAQLESQAQWRRRLGTSDGPRYPGLGINLRNSDGALLADAVLGLEVGDRLTAAAAALPVQHPPNGLDQLVVGWQHVVDADEWKIFPVCAPYTPYIVAEVDSNTRVTAEGSTLGASLTSTATSFSLASTVANGVWTTLAADFPLDVNVGGERIRLSTISGASSPQTATVAPSGRSINGVVKAHASGTAVAMWEDAVVAL